MVGGKPATYSQEPKLAQKRKARGQNLAEEGKLEAKMQSKINKTAAKWKPIGSQKVSTGSPNSLRLSMKVLG